MLLGAAALAFVAWVAMTLLPAMRGAR
jgi:hypothetical protein